MNKDLRSMTIEELTEALESVGEKKFRARQIFSWLHKNQVKSLDEMTNIPKKLKEKLLKSYDISYLKVCQVLESKIDGTCKYLFELQDGNIIESVFMRYKHGNSVCISSQVGCRMGCKFCASTIDGLQRNLQAGEMLEQIYRIEEDKGERISNIVVMGSGEPFDNFDNLIRFIELICNEEGANISQRNITVSTCGLIPRIYDLAELRLQITLAISLHASSQEKRMSLMPVANKYGIDDLIKACKDYFDKTGRRLTFEYSLVAGVNDTDEDASQLLTLLKGINCHVNLIPVNPIKERDYKQSDASAIQKFKNKLEKNGQNVTIRREMGRDINGACGQLRRSYINDERR